MKIPKLDPASEPLHGGSVCHAYHACHVHGHICVGELGSPVFNFTGTSTSTVVRQAIRHPLGASKTVGFSRVSA